MINLPNDIYQCRFDLFKDGVRETGYPIVLNIQNQNIEITPVFWDSDKDVALSGTKRSNIRGYDLNVTLDYNASLEPDKVETIFDALPNLADNSYQMRFYIDDGTATYVDMIPTGDTGMSIEFDNTVRKGGANAVIPTFGLESRNYVTILDDFFN